NMRALLPLLAAPFPRCLHCPDPDTTARTPSGNLRDQIGRPGIVGVTQGPALPNQPGAAVSIPRAAIGDHAAVAIPVALDTPHVPIPQSRIQRIRRRRPAPPGSTARRPAGLPPLGRVHAPKPNALTPNLKGVAVDHRGAPNQVRLDWRA